MKILLTTAFSLILSLLVIGQNTIKGSLEDEANLPVMFANVVLLNAEDGALIKVESTDESGMFQFRNIVNGKYKIEASFIGLNTYTSDVFMVNGDMDLGKVEMTSNSVELETAVVKAKRALVEVKPDRTVFNVEGTINSVGDNVMELLRKAPGVLVDNNNNVTVLSRSGVLIYVDGKRLPLSGSDLTAYLENLTADQIDRIDIITNPGAKYEAQGNAGIIDIRMKRNKNHGMNGSVSLTGSKGRYAKGNISSQGNYRNSVLNTFGTIGYSNGKSYHDMNFYNQQNQLITDEINTSDILKESINYRWGTDFYVGKNQTIGFLISGNDQNGSNDTYNKVKISKLSAPTFIDSVLIADNESKDVGQQRTYNLNYVYDNKKQSLNIDLDYGKYKNDNAYIQPNRYFLEDEKTRLSEILTEYDTPVNIDIATAKIDYETEALGGKVGLGTKLSSVSTDNTYKFYNVDGTGNRVLSNRRSNEFYYDENVYAAYVNYQRQINAKWQMSAGMRSETTDAKGDLIAYLPELQKPPVKLDYTNFFPSAGLTYQYKRNMAFSLNYGRRVNRPDYNVLNPFTIQLSELSFRKGNEKLNPEIVNNIELGYTLNYRFNFKLSYSKTTDQITRLIAPDDKDPRAGFITWANLAEQTVYGFNAALPFAMNNWWNAFFNFSAGYLNNQAKYDDGGVVDVQATTYSIYQQHTFTLPAGFVGEVSGYFSGPGVWGGVFRYNENWALNLGLQKKFFNDMMNVKLSVNDVFRQSGWDGESSFNGLVSSGSGMWDSRRVALSVSYNFGNKNVQSRKRKTGLEDESKRVK